MPNKEIKQFIKNQKKLHEKYYPAMNGEENNLNCVRLHITQEGIDDANRQIQRGVDSNHAADAQKEWFARTHLVE